MKQISCVILVSWLLGGCLANGPVPAESEAQLAAVDTLVPHVAAGQGAASTAAVTDETLQRNLETLANRLTLVQEQLIQIKAQGAELNQQSDTALARLIGQLSLISNELSLSGVGDSYRIAADYTGAGQWVLIRYDRFSGESWLADQGAWQPLQDSASLQRSDYEVQLTRADNDIKGYVAARLDRRSGDTWWLKQDRWQKFER